MRRAQPIIVATQQFFQFGVITRGEQTEMALHQFQRQSAPRRIGQHNFQLQSQALGQIARAHAARIKVCKCLSAVCNSIGSTSSGSISASSSRLWVR